MISGVIGLGVLLIALAAGATSKIRSPVELALIAGPPLVIAAVCLLTIPIFSRLQIAVRRDRVAWSFGWGLFGKSLPLADLASVGEPRSRPVGLGYRMAAGVRYYWIGGTPGVEFTSRSSGMRYVVSCSDPAAIAAAIKRARSSSS